MAGRRVLLINETAAPAEKSASPNVQVDEIRVEIRVIFPNTATYDEVDKALHAASDRAEGRVWETFHPWRHTDVAI